MGKNLSEADVRRIVRDEIAKDRNARRTVVAWGILPEECRDDIDTVEAILNAAGQCTCGPHTICYSCLTRAAH
jgi:hypothetical protein